jgi:hypothetical protein
MILNIFGWHNPHHFTTVVFYSVGIPLGILDDISNIRKLKLIFVNKGNNALLADLGYGKK